MSDDTVVAGLDCSTKIRLTAEFAVPHVYYVLYINVTCGEVRCLFRS